MLFIILLYYILTKFKINRKCEGYVKSVKNIIHKVFLCNVLVNLKKVMLCEGLDHFLTKCFFEIRHPSFHQKTLISKHQNPSRRHILFF
jgi:hypothetical protein